MIKSKLAALAIVFSAMGATANAEATPDTTFTRFGTWTAPCDAWGVEATCTSTWSPGLAANHVVQDYSIVRTSDQMPLFSGRGLYRLNEGDIDGVWEDSRGTLMDLTGRFVDNSMKVVWVDPQIEIGRSEYTWMDDGLNASDSVLTDSGWRNFMTVDYIQE